MDFVDAYTKSHSISVETALKNALLEKIKDENDLSVAENAYQEYIDNGRKSRPIKKLWQELEI